MKLTGIKVIELSQFLPGPHLTMTMADHGATVIKVEPFSGEPARTMGAEATADQGMSVWFRNTHRGKQSLRLNLKDPRGKEVLLKLCETADVLVESFRPGVVDRLGIGYEAVRARAPQIVYCSISAFGQTGANRHKPAHDIAMQAMAGTLAFNQDAQGQPVNPPMVMADMAGSLTALSGILMALLQQKQTGQGDYLDIAMHDALFAWTANYIGPIFAEGRDHVVKEGRNWGGAAFYNIYATSDGQHLVLGGMEHKFCENFLNKAQRPDLIAATNLPPGPGQAPAIAFLRDWFAARTQAEALAWLADIDVCYAPLRTLREAAQDPNLAARGMVLKDAEGHQHLGPPIRFTGAASAAAQPNLHVPALGEHSRAILRQAGYDAAAIEGLLADGVV